MINDLVIECEKRISWKNITSCLDSFKGNFEDYKKIIVDNQLRDDEVDKFIEVCDNRIDCAKTFLQDVATVLGFFSSSLAIVLALSVLERGKNHVDSFLDLLGEYGILFPILVFSLIAGIVILFGLLLYYRTHIHAWTAFKEVAILKEKNTIIMEDNTNLEKNCPPSLTDWVLFLSFEINNIKYFDIIPLVNLIVVVLVAYIGYMISSLNITALAPSLAPSLVSQFPKVFISLGVVSIAVFIIYFCTGYTAYNKEKAFKSIRKRIICGELTDPNQIRREWEKRG